MTNYISTKDIIPTIFPDEEMKRYTTDQLAKVTESKKQLSLLLDKADWCGLMTFLEELKIYAPECKQDGVHLPCIRPIYLARIQHQLNEKYGILYTDSSALYNNTFDTDDVDAEEGYYINTFGQVKVFLIDNKDIFISLGGESLYRSLNILFLDEKYQEMSSKILALVGNNSNLFREEDIVSTRNALANLQAMK